MTMGSIPLLLFSPLAAAFLSLLGKLLSSNLLPKLAFTLWVSGTVAGLILSTQILFSGQSIIYHMGGWSAPYGITNQIRGPVLIATLADLLIAGAAWLQTRRFRRYDQTFSFFFFLALFSLQGIMLTRDLFNLFVWFEVLSLCSFILIAYFRSPTSLTAAIRYLL